MRGAEGDASGRGVRVVRRLRTTRQQWDAQRARLDPVADCTEVMRLVSAHEFPWDLQQALSFALFRTYAVPSIGALLDRTGELTVRTQKRYEDTGLLLDGVLEHGPDSAPGRAAVRRINQMHSAYDIEPDDLRYVLATFVVIPVRWVQEHGWRPFEQGERVASVHYYGRLGELMGIRDLPSTWQGYADLLDDYERTHFALDPGARRVADATLDLLTELPPQHLLPRRLVRLLALAVMDEPLLDALGYRHPPALVRRGVRRALRLRSAVVRRLPPRTSPRWFRQQPAVRGYPAATRSPTSGPSPRRAPSPTAPAEPAGGRTTAPPPWGRRGRADHAVPSCLTRQAR